MKDAESQSPRQEAIQLATNYLRAIVEVAPRDQKPDSVLEWKEKMLEQLANFEPSDVFTSDHERRNKPWDISSLPGTIHDA